MPFDDPTANFGWSLPDDGADLDTWGDGDPEGLDAIITAIDTDTKTVDDAGDAMAASAVSLTSRVDSLESGLFLPVYAQVVMVAPFPLIPSPTPTVLDFTTATEVDSQGMFSFSQPTRLTVPDGSIGDLSGGGRLNLAGLYDLRAAVEVPLKHGNDDGRRWTLELVKNGTTTIAVRRYPALNDGNHPNTGNLTLELAAMDVGGVGDFYEIRVTTDVSAIILAASFGAYRLPSPRTAVPRVLYSAGYDVHGADAEDFTIYDAIVGTPGVELNWLSTGGKFGGGRLKFDKFITVRGKTTKKVLATPAIAGVVTGYVSVPNGLVSSDGFTPLAVSLGGTRQLTLSFDEDGVLDVSDDSGVLGTGTTVLLGDGTQYHVEMAFILSATGGTGVVLVWLDGALEISLSGIDVGPNGTWDEVEIESSSNRHMMVDDLVVQDALGIQLGDGHRIWTVMPDSDDGTNEWTPSTGTDHFAVVDELDHSTADILTASSGTFREEFGFTLPAITGVIREVIVHAIVNHSTPKVVALGLRHGTEETVTAIDLFGASIGFDLDAAVSVAGNPNGGLWALADLATAVIVVERQDASGGNIEVSQIRLEIITTVT